MIKRMVKNLLMNRAPTVYHRARMLKQVQLGLGEPELLMLPRYIKRSSIFVDVGANAGFFSSYMQSFVRKVIAIEPNPTMVEYLQKVLTQTCQVLPCGVSDKILDHQVLRIPTAAKGKKELDGLATMETSNRLEGTGADGVKEIHVDVRTLDDICQDETEVDLIKIDVEGHELQVLKGAEDLMKRDRPIFLVEIEKRHNPQSFEETFFFMEDRGYTCQFLSEYKLEAFSKFDVNILQSEEALARKLQFPFYPGYINNFFFFPPDVLGPKDSP